MILRQFFVFASLRRSLLHRLKTRSFSHSRNWGLGLFLIFAAGCGPNMARQPKYTPYSESDFFPDGRSARPAVEGTVARGRLRDDERVYTGRAEGALLGTIPVPVNRGMLERGQERFAIFCTPCHGYLGNGDGLVVQRGYRHPPSYHIARLREAPDGHIFDVMTNGFGAMPSYAAQISPADRWAITAYIRALQLSQSASLQDVPPGERKILFGVQR